TLAALVLAAPEDSPVTAFTQATRAEAADRVVTHINGSRLPVPVRSGDLRTGFVGLFAGGGAATLVPGAGVWDLSVVAVGLTASVAAGRYWVSHAVRLHRGDRLTRPIRVSKYTRPPRWVLLDQWKSPSAVVNDIMETWDLVSGDAAAVSGLRELLWSLD